MDENNLSQEEWLEELLTRSRAKKESSEPVQGDTQPLPQLPKSQPQEDELEAIIREFGGAQPQEPFMDEDFRDTFGQGEDLKQVFDQQPVVQTPVPVPEEKEKPVDKIEEEGPVEKGRPKRKKGEGLFGLPHLAATAVWLIIIITIGISIGRLGWMCASDVLALGR